MGRRQGNSQRMKLFGTPIGAGMTAEAQARAVTSGRIEIRCLPEESAVNEPMAHAPAQCERDGSAELANMG